ncbi:GNAT family N-acetyltransferase [Pseudorhodoferax sp. Leaf267]|uniref:GNAT family N-acetyltransferase n=1 Tax=Pseudorhodoferax sp. Leaf267 TaxID=1736316 RepID=UPI0006F59E9D|nr:GNAT family N-acetyltransferase [Pseudorhodoferax sp. Leaf267]KQP17828.1 hypothetical protein ASF43_08125 [Pseudorhodoferax sp. Leaf267]
MAKSKSLISRARRAAHKGMRKAFAFLPQSARFAVARSFVDGDPSPDPRLTLKIADTQEELEACFRLLHDAYVAVGFMKPDPSGMRATIYHALPTTTTLCAKYDDRVVGTISLIRQSPFGFPLQAVFDLSSVEAEPGQIAEVSALAVHPEFRKTGGAILFPLMKFMHAYCTRYFDTRHLVIAVNPYHIELYESLLSFRRLPQKTVAAYDFANGAPAVGATLDLGTADAVFAKVYAGKPPRKSLHHYFFKMELPNIQMPARRYFTTNDPVMTPQLLDYFFNQKTQGFTQLDARKKAMLHEIYDLPAYRAVLPTPDQAPAQMDTLRRHPRFSLKCKGKLEIEIDGQRRLIDLQVVDVSNEGFQAHARENLPLKASGRVVVHLGADEQSVLQTTVMRGRRYDDYGAYGFLINEADAVWRECVHALQSGHTHHDLVQQAAAA